MDVRRPQDPQDSCWSIQQFPFRGGHSYQLIGEAH